MLYKEWIDFVVFPTNPTNITSLKQRIDVANAVRFESPEYENHEVVLERGFIFTKDQIIFDDDDFEAIVINDYGDVCIWTRKRVWTLLRRFGGMEKLIYVSRHPNSAGLV